MTSGIRDSNVDVLCEHPLLVSRPEGTGGDLALEEEQTPSSNPRYEQMFPVLTESEIGRVSRFGVACSYAAGEIRYQPSESDITQFEKEENG
jgi:hypothetical protein